MKNIIIFHTDELRYDSLGCNGNKNAKTPNIDNLAKEGYNFNRHIAANPVCMPSRASLMTGLNVPAHGVSSNGIALWRRDNGCPDENNAISQQIYQIDIPNKIPTMADVFKENGYSTALFGKLHLQPHLADPSYNFYESKSFWDKPEAIEYDGDFYGFESHKLALGHGEAPCDYNGGHYGRWLNENYPEVVQAVHEQAKKRNDNGSNKSIYLSKVPSELHHSMWLANESCSYIDEHKDDTKPMFMFIGFPDPHSPFVPPEDIVEEFLDIPLPEFSDREKIVGESVSTIAKSLVRLSSTDENIATAYRYTQASTYLIDKAIGKVIQKLKDNGMYDDTIIVFTADHGDMLGSFGTILKCDAPFIDLIHIPFIVKPAKDFDMSKEVDTGVAMSNIDVFPTLANMANISVPETLQGIDIFGQKASVNKPMTTCYNAYGKDRNVSILDREYRYTYYIDTREEELYDHTKDPYEYENLALSNDEKYIELCKKMKQEVMTKHIESDIGIYNHYGLW